MARTKASVGAKVSSGKSSKARCSVVPPPSSSTSSGSSRSTHSSGGGNPVCPQPTPKWQRPITNFFISQDPEHSEHKSDDGPSSSKVRRRTNVIDSDGEDEPRSETPSNSALDHNNGALDHNDGALGHNDSVLDQSVELAPLRGDDSHKIEEYYQKNGLKQNGDPNGNYEENNEESVPKNGENLPQKRGKGKGVGKKTNKENISSNVEVGVERKNSLKRDLDEINIDSDRVSKKVKIN